MEYPALVFKCPGPHKHAKGTYDLVVVQDEDEHVEKLKSGWFATLPEAIDGKTVSLNVAEPDVESAPTRAELETKAAELNILFDGRTSDAKLLAKINEALKA